MELRLSNVLILLFKSLCNDIQSFFKGVRFFLQTFPMIWFTKWDQSWRISNTCDNQNPCKISRSFEGEEMNGMMSRVGMVCGFEGFYDYENASFGELMRSLFEEEEPSLDEIKETFEVFDVNNDGFIDASELHGVLCRLGLQEKGLEDCKKMIEAFDGNGDGLIDFHEFLKFMEISLS